MKRSLLLMCLVAMSAGKQAKGNLQSVYMCLGNQVTQRNQVTLVIREHVYMYCSNLVTVYTVHVDMQQVRILISWTEKASSNHFSLLCAFVCVGLNEFL